MSKKLVLRRSIVLAALAAPLSSPTLATHGWRSRPIRLVVPYPPGGAAGIWARLLVAGIGDAMGEPLLVDHRAATGGLTAAEAVARAPADGHTLLFTTSSHVIASHGVAHPPYNPGNDFAPIAKLGSAPLVLAASPAFPGTTPEELQVWLRQHGATFGSTGVRSRAHAFGVILAEALGATVEHVPYPGEGLMMSDLRNRGLSFAFCSPATVGGISGARSLRMLAATGSSRMPTLADIPLLIEEGYSEEFAIDGFVGIFAPAGTPQPILDRTSGVLYALMSDPAFRQRLADAYLRPEWQGPVDFGESLLSFMRQWQVLIQRRRLQSAT